MAKTFAFCPYRPTQSLLLLWAYCSISLGALESFYSSPSSCKELQPAGVFCNVLMLHSCKQSRTLLPAQSRKLPKHHHITPVLKSLNWLKVSQRIHYKIGLVSLTYNTLQTSKPFYIRQLIQPPGSTRSSS